MPTAAHKSTALSTGVSTAPSVTIGAATSGDTKVLVLFAKSTSHSVTLSATPSGYTQRAAWTEWDDGDSYVAVYSKAVTTSESSGAVGFTLSASSPWALAGFVATGDWDAISTEASGRIGYGTSASAGSVTASTTNTVLFNALMAVLWRNFAPPAGLTETNDVRDSSLEISAATGNESIASAGATGTRTWTFRDAEDPNSLLGSAGRSVAFTIKGSTSGGTNSELNGSTTFPSGAYTYATTSITASPASFSVSSAAASQTVTLVDQNGVAVEGATWSTSDATVASVTPTTNSAGQAIVAFGAIGSATLTASYDDGMSSPTTRTVSVTVGTSQAPGVTTASLPAGTLGSSYSHTLLASGAATITWSLASGSLPAGLSLNGSTGAITGTPTLLGTSQFAVRATNSYGTSDRTLSISVLASASTSIASPWAKWLTK